MNVFTTDKIRNVVLLGHGGSGKTSLVEAMAYLAGMTKRMGSVENGNTVSDYDKEEIKRGISIRTSVIPIPWDGYKINILDTPGAFDFIGETEEAAAVADAAIIVISAKAGIEAGTKRAWNLCEKRNLPRMFFVTDMDIDKASYRKVVQELQDLYGKKIAPLHLPIRENEQFVGYVNVIQQRAKRWNNHGTVDKFDVPEYSKENLGICRDVLMESVAAFGVLPPVSILTPEQTQYYFLSGFTAKLAGTERGITEPTPTFSACFGQAFLELHPTKYGEELVKKMQKSGAKAYLVNTGWNGTGKRISIKDTRGIIDAILNGDVNKAETKKIPYFDFEVPTSLPGVDPAILDPRDTYADASEWEAKAKDLAERFVKNFKKYETNEAGKALVAAGPQL